MAFLWRKENISHWLSARKLADGIPSLRCLRGETRMQG